MRWVTAALILLGLVGCDSADELAVRQWTLLLDNGRTRAVRLPVHLDSILSTPRAVYRLRANVSVPPRLRGKRLKLVLPALQSAARLRVNGQRAVPLTPELPRGYRRAGPQTWLIPERFTAALKLRLELEVQHSWFKSPWLDGAPTLLPYDDTSRAARIWSVSKMSQEAGVASLFTITIISLWIFLLSRRGMLSAGWLAVQSVLAMQIMMFDLGHLQGLFGRSDYLIMVISLSGAITVSAYAMRHQFALSSVHWIWPALLGGVILSALVTMSSMAVGARITSLLVVLLVAAGFVRLLFNSFWVAWKRPEHPNCRLHLVSWLFLSLLCVPDMIAWIGYGGLFPGWQLKGVGFTIYCLLQLGAVAREHRSALIAVQQRSEDLQARGQEIEELNEELRGQVGERSRQLFTALALAGQQPTMVQRLEKGERLAERFVVERLLGEGGMGVVYLARRLKDQLLVALKVPKGLQGNTLARFAREAMLVSQVNHPNVVQIYDVDITQQGILYIVLEYIDGPKLSEFREKRRDLRWAVPMLYQVACGLRSLHALEIIHRDLKPSNVMLANHNRPGRQLCKITDFGISYATGGEASGLSVRAQPVDIPGSAAELGHTEISPPSTMALLKPLLARTSQKASPPVDSVRDAASGSDHSASDDDTLARDPERTLPLEIDAPESAPMVPVPSLEGFSVPAWDSSLTETGIVTGTPPYIALENALGSSHVTTSSDLFSFGVMAFEMLCDRYPFVEPPLLALVGKREIAPASTFEEACPDLDARVGAMLNACLDFDPLARPTAAEVVDVLAAYMDRQGLDKDGVAAEEQS